VLFGSAARQEQDPRDLDLGVVGSGPLDVVAITNALTRALGTQSIDVTDLRRADPVLLALAARDGRALFETEPGVFAQFVSVAARRFADTRKFRDAQAQALRAAIGPRSAAPLPSSIARWCAASWRRSPATWRTLHPSRR